MAVVIRLEKIGLRYRVPRERIHSLKEYTIRRLQRRLAYDELEALQDVDLVVEPGERIGVIGRNGAGKSTLFRVISRVLPPSAGRVYVAGRIAPILELGLGFHGELTARENVMLQGALLGFSRADMRQRLERIVEWAKDRPKLVGIAYPEGERLGQCSQRAEVSLRPFTFYIAI